MTSPVIDDPNRRVIIVGDIHGMNKPFEYVSIFSHLHYTDVFQSRKLLKKVGYNPQSDVLVHVGDVLTRGPHNGSVAVIDFLTAHNVIGVRGNHDQKIIAWRGWMDWFATLDGGKEWLSDLRSKWLAGRARGQSLKSWVKEQRKESRGKDARWWGYVPEDWIPFGDHYRIAERLTEAQYSYLLSLPLKIHIPSAHAFIIHAGLLPFDVRYDYDDHRRQPLARVPRTPAYSLSHSSNKIENLRNLQELAVLQRVSQNTDPWVNLNMRSVTKKKKISRFVPSIAGVDPHPFLKYALGIQRGVHRGRSIGMIKCPCATGLTKDSEFFTLQKSSAFSLMLRISHPERSHCLATPQV